VRNRISGGCGKGCHRMSMPVGRSLFVL
jgi:hypothetical protein